MLTVSDDISPLSLSHRGSDPVQLRICSCHFSGGEKKEGDVPVPDPEVDEPINIDISGATNNSNTNHSSPSRCLMDKQKRAAKRQRMSVDRIVEGGLRSLTL